MWRALLRASEWIVELPVTSTSVLNTPEIDHISTCRTFRSSEKCHKISHWKWQIINIAKHTHWLQSTLTAFSDRNKNSLATEQMCCLKHWQRVTGTLINPQVRVLFQQALTAGTIPFSLWINSKHCHTDYSTFVTHITQIQDRLLPARALTG